MRDRSVLKIFFNPHMRNLSVRVSTSPLSENACRVSSVEHARREFSHRIYFRLFIDICIVSFLQKRYC